MALDPQQIMMILQRLGIDPSKINLIPGMNDPRLQNMPVTPGRRLPTRPAGPAYPGNILAAGPREPSIPTPDITRSYPSMPSGLSDTAVTELPIPPLDGPNRTIMDTGSFPRSRFPTQLGPQAIHGVAFQPPPALPSTIPAPPPGESFGFKPGDVLDLRGSNFNGPKMSTSGSIDYSKFPAMGVPSSSDMKYINGPSRNAIPPPPAHSLPPPAAKGAPNLGVSKPSLTPGMTPTELPIPSLAPTSMPPSSTGLPWSQLPRAVDMTLPMGATQPMIRSSMPDPMPSMRSPIRSLGMGLGGLGLMGLGALSDYKSGTPGAQAIANQIGGPTPDNPEVSRGVVEQAQQRNQLNRASPFRAMDMNDIAILLQSLGINTGQLGRR